jgi:hypothetical protein
MSDADGNEKTEAMARFREAMERVKSGDPETEEVELPSGERVRLVHDPDSPGGLRIEALDGGPVGGGRKGMPEEWKEFQEEVKAASERVRSGESDLEELTLPDGETMRLIRDPEVPGAYVVESSQAEQTLRAVTFEPASERPTGYPDDLPFLPNCPCSVTTISGADARSVTWFGPPEPTLALESLGAQLVGEGWMKEPEGDVSHPFGKTRHVRFMRDGRHTNLILNEVDGKAHLMLMQGGPEAGGGTEVPWR